MYIIKNKKIFVPIIVFFAVTVLVIGMIIFIPKIQKILEDAKWKKGIYILPTSQYHAFGRDEFTTITQLNFVCVKESEETFLNFLNETHFILSDGGTFGLGFEYDETMIYGNHESINLVKNGELYQHYAVNFLMEFKTREYREFDRVIIGKDSIILKTLNIGRIIYDFYDYEKSISSRVYNPTIVTERDFKLPVRHNVIDEVDYTIDSVIVKLNDAISESKEINSSELFFFEVNTVCSANGCAYGMDPSFTTTNDFLTFTFKPQTKYLVNDVEYFDTYRFPLIYFRVLEDDKYFEVSDTFTNLLDSSN